MKTLLYIASFFFLLGCQSGPKPEISLLEGYWEIEHVQTPQGQQKEFGPNILVDYFQLNIVDKFIIFNRKTRVKFVRLMQQ